jgi:protein-L-isoaspartate(D-aspartate) O-methyltransferase
MRRSLSITTFVLVFVAGLWLGPGSISAQDAFQTMRQDMVDFQLRGRGIRQPLLLDAMATVPRHLFVPQSVRNEAYYDQPLPIGSTGGGIMQPYITALMIELLELDGTQKVLEIGTGSGYDAAVLSQLAAQVFTIEISEELGRSAQQRLAELGFDNVSVRVGDGYEGWPSEAPFDAILLTAAPEEVPPKLLEQLKTNGRMVLAVGGFVQNLTAIRKTPQGLQTSRIEPVRISPMSAEDK